MEKKEPLNGGELRQEKAIGEAMKKYRITMPIRAEHDETLRRFLETRLPARGMGMTKTYKRLLHATTLA